MAEAMGVTASCTAGQGMIRQRPEGNTVQHDLVPCAGSNFQSLTLSGLFFDIFKPSISSGGGGVPRDNYHNKAQGMITWKPLHKAHLFCKAPASSFIRMDSMD